MHRILGHVAPSEIVNKEDLQQAADSDLWMHDCRCGGHYMIQQSELNLYTQILMPCDTCSLYVCLDTSADKPSEVPRAWCSDA